MRSTRLAARPAARRSPLPPLPRNVRFPSKFVSRVSAADAASPSAATASRKVIILYTKASCPLCEGARDRVQGLIDRAQFMPSAISEYTLELRDISTNAEWQAAYDLEVPVLAVLGPDGQEARIPRPPPRMTTDKLRQHIEKCLPQ